MHALCMLDTSVYSHTLRICNTYYFFSFTNAPQCDVYTYNAGLFEMSAAQHIMHYCEVTVVYTAECVYFVTGQVLP